MSSEAFPIDVVTLATESDTPERTGSDWRASYLIIIDRRSAQGGEHRSLREGRPRQIAATPAHPTANNIISTCADAADDAGEILDRAESEVFSLGQEQIQTGFVHVKDISKRASRASTRCMTGASG